MTCGIIDGTGIEDGTHHRRQEVGISARKLARQESICIWGVPLGSEGILKLSSTCTQRPTCLLRLAQYIAAPLVHHTRPAAVPLGANPPVALLLQNMHLRALVLVTIGFSPVQKGIWSEIRGFLLGTFIFYVRGSRACRDSV